MKSSKSTLKRSIQLIVLVLLITACGKDEETQASIEVNLDVSQLLSTVNGHRQNGAVCGSSQMSAVNDLIWSDELAKAALDHSNDMQQNDYFSHTGLNGSQFSERVLDAGFEGAPVGENIASGYQTLDAVLQGWMESSGHCTNIMNGNATHIGVARSNEGALWTMILGRIN